MTTETEQAVREAWAALWCAETSSDPRALSDAADTVDAAIRADERARLAAHVGPLTTNEDSINAARNGFQVWGGRILGAEIDALRAQVAALRAERDEARETLASITVPCSCTHEAGDSPCELHPVCEYCGEPAGPATCHCATMDGRCHGCPMPRHELETSLAELESALTREREAHARLEEALGDIVQRIDENPNETCPFCEPVQNDDGADHEPECLITAAHAALRGAR